MTFSIEIEEREDAEMRMGELETGRVRDGGCTPYIHWEFLM
jgi:hypothetical protein